MPSSSSPRPQPTAEELAGLAEKYRTLAALRAARDGTAGTGAIDRETLRALSDRFPGALRELDTLGLPELLRRARSAEAAATGAPAEPWMTWIVSFHRGLAAALSIKRTTAAARRNGPPLTTADHERLAEAAARASGLALGVDFVHAVDRPPGGRLTPLLLRTIAHAFGIAPEAVAGALFPPRRR